MSKILIVFLIFCASFSFAQQKTIVGRVVDKETSEPIIGAIVKVENTPLGAKTDTSGNYKISGIRSDSCLLLVRYLGYAEFMTMVHFAAEHDTMEVSIELNPEELEGEEVVITGTRTLRNIADVPVRVEAIPEEEIEEKIMMRASNVSILLSETPGLRVQTTSSTSNTTNLRIWGLPGRYTQILTDGIPNLGGLSSGFSITQFPPLNIRQVEIIKGASSVLYGADAIGGVVNFLLREPTAEEHLSTLLNITSEGGQDAAAYYSNGSQQFRGSLFASYNRQHEHDINGDRMSDLAAYDRINLAPQLVYNYSDDLQFKLTGGYVHELRRGGVMDAPDSVIGKSAPYIEQNISDRYYYTLHSDWKTGEQSALSLNVASVWLDRTAHYGETPFDGSQNDNYVDVQYTVDEGSHSLLVGGAFNANTFEDNTIRTTERLSYSYAAPALFVQDEWAVSKDFKILTGARADFHNTVGTFFTPRLSFFYKPDESITMRLSGGMGFKAPTPFVEEAEETGYRDVRGFHSLKAERAQSISYDLNWRTLIADEIGLSINTALFYTQLNDALTVNEDSIDNRVVILENVTGATVSRGLELTAQLTYDHFKLMAGYTYNYIIQEHHDQQYEMELNPRHNLGIILMFEDHENGWRAGFENYFIGTQRVDRNPFRTETPSYWLTGALVEKAFGNFRVYINFENMFDTRHTRYDPTFTGDPFVTGKFKTLHIYAPLEGRAINGGIRYSF